MSLPNSTMTLSQSNDEQLHPDSSTPQLTFQKPFLFYLKINANPRLSFKLMQIAKFFRFKEFPFIVIKDIHYYYGKWKYVPLNGKKLRPFNADKISKKLWITKDFEAGLSSPNTSSIFPKIAVCDITYLRLEHQELTLDELKFFINAKLKSVEFFDTWIFDSNDKRCLIEAILREFLNVQSFLFQSEDNEEYATSSTKEIMKYLKDAKIKKFYLFGTPEIFDYSAFKKFRKENPQIYYSIT